MTEYQTDLSKVRAVCFDGWRDRQAVWHFWWELFDTWREWKQFREWR